MENSKDDLHEHQLAVNDSDIDEWIAEEKDHLSLAKESA